MHCSTFAFVASHFKSLDQCAAWSNGILNRCRKCDTSGGTTTPSWQRIYASADANETQGNINLRESLPMDLPKPELATDQVAAAAQALLDDLADRPQYYLNISGVLVGITLSCVVLSATVVALDSIPFVPDMLRMIGLAYLFWFLNKFLFSAAERERLGDEISEFVSGVRGGDVTKLEQVEDA